MYIINTINKFWGCSSDEFFWFPCKGSNMFSSITKFPFPHNKISERSSMEGSSTMLQGIKIQERSKFLIYPLNFGNGPSKKK